MPYHNYIDVLKEEEKRLYRILKELEHNGESLIENADSPEWNGVLRKLGVKAKPLIKKELLDPIYRVDYHSKHSDRRLIRVPKDVVVEEKGQTKSYFLFKKKKN